MAGSSFSDIALEVGQGNVNQATGRAQNRPTVATDISLIALDVGQGGNQQTASMGPWVVTQGNNLPPLVLY